MAGGRTRIRVYGAACLRERAEALTPGTPEIPAVLDDLWAALGEDGVGLAAPQIGHKVRAMVVQEPGRTAGRRRLEMINPELVETFGPVAPFEEGCLSFPGLFATVWRSQGAVIAYQDRDGTPSRLRDEGLLARIIQHELDHLEGILFVDRLPAWQRLLLQPRLFWLRLRERRADKGEW